MYTLHAPNCIPIAVKWWVAWRGSDGLLYIRLSQNCKVVIARDEGLQPFSLERLANRSAAKSQFTSLPRDGVAMKPGDIIHILRMAAHEVDVGTHLKQ
jgi:hypothetical protein